MQKCIFQGNVHVHQRIFRREHRSRASFNRPISTEQAGSDSCCEDRVRTCLSQFDSMMGYYIGGYTWELGRNIWELKSVPCGVTVTLTLCEVY